MEFSNPLIVFIFKEWFLLLLLTLLFGIYFHYTSTYAFFEERGVKFLKPTFLLGNLGPRLMMRKSIHEFQNDLYIYFKGQRFGGVFDGRRPVFLIRDPELIKAIMIRDFDHFVDRNALLSREPSYLRRSLLNLMGKEWKAVRSILTPTFSSSRLRSMLFLIENCSEQMVNSLRKHANSDVEMKDFMGHFTLEVIGACAFGIKCNAFSDESADFVKIAEKFNYMSKSKRIFIFLLLIFMPQAFRFLNISFLNQETTEKLVKMLNATKTERRRSHMKANDFLQLMIDAAEKENLDSSEVNKKMYLDDDTIDAQSLLFLIAGYETSSTLLSFAIHVLAAKPHIQSKLRSHIQDSTKGKDMSYELLSQLDYLEGFLLETLRMYPPLARVDRICTKEYVLPGTSVKIEPGNVVAIPVYGIQMDPDIFPEPNEFIPERFTEENKKERPSHFFLAFGAGPRNCIGKRFAMISAKLAMVALLKNFKFSLCEKSVHPVVFEKKGILLKAANGLWVRVEDINKKEE